MSKKFDKYKNNVRKYRLQLGLSQSQLAKKIEVSKSAIINWESYRSGISSENLVKLLILFDIERKQLLEF